MHGRVQRASTQLFLLENCDSSQSNCDPVVLYDGRAPVLQHLLYSLFVLKITHSAYTRMYTR